MSEWQKVKLSEVLTLKKGSIKIHDDTEYKLCRVRLHRRGVLLRGKQFGHEIKTKKQQVCKSGDLIVAEMDAKFGGYGFIPDELEGAIVSSHYYLYELDKSKISQNYFETLINTDYIQNQIEAKGSTNYSSIRAKEFLEYEIPLASQELQAEISKRFLTFSNFTSKLNLEHENQQTYLTKLRQALLQEAIEGKLTADWRVKNPVQKGNPDHDAQALLETIKAQKQKLISDKKIKKEKPLSPINPDDVPFALPDGWVWVRLGNLTELITSGSRDWAIYYKDDGRAKFIRMGNLSHDWFNLKNNKIQMVEPPKSEGTRTSLIENDLLISITGDIGWKALIPKNFGEGYINQHTALVRFTNLLKGKFFPMILCSSFSKKQFNAPQRGIKNSLRLSDISEHLIPLPPLAEQNAIVERLDRLLESVNTLEQQVTERKNYAEQLMQAVLKEAFTVRNEHETT